MRGRGVREAIQRLIPVLAERFEAAERAMTDLSMPPEVARAALREVRAHVVVTTDSRTSTLSAVVVLNIRGRDAMTRSRDRSRFRRHR